MANDDGANESQFFVTPPGGTNDWAEDDENGQPFWDAAINDAGDRHAGNVNALRRDGSVSAESSDDLLENHPASGSGDWVPWRVPMTKHHGWGLQILRLISTETAMGLPTTKTTAPIRRIQIRPMRMTMGSGMPAM